MRLVRGGLEGRRHGLRHAAEELPVEPVLGRSTPRHGAGLLRAGEGRDPDHGDRLFSEFSHLPPVARVRRLRAVHGGNDVRRADANAGPGSGADAGQAIDAFDRFISSPIPTARCSKRPRGEAGGHRPASPSTSTRWLAGRPGATRIGTRQSTAPSSRSTSYPETTLKCELYFVLGEAHKQGKQFEDAVRYYEQVVNEYPDCEYVDDAKERLRDINGVLPAALRGGRVS